MSAETYYLVALDVERDKIALQRKLSREAAASIFDREVDFASQEHVVKYEPLSLFKRRIQLLHESAALDLQEFVQGLNGNTHVVILLLRGDAALYPQELAQVKEALLEYYSSRRL